MIKNFIVLAWRNLIKHPTLSIINLTGLSLSLSFCLLLIFHISKEYSYDSFHKAKDRLYRVEMTNLWPSTEPKAKASFFSTLTKEDNDDMDDIFPLIVGRDIQAAFPEVRHAVRFQNNEDMLIRTGNKTFKIPHTLYADSSLFLSFSFPMIRGNATSAFANPGSVILSASTAKILFGSADPIGQRLSILSDSSHEFIVRGIAADAPDNSSIQFGLVFPLTADPDYEENIKSGFNHMSHLLILELKEGVSLPAFQAKLDKWMQAYATKYLDRDYKDRKIARYEWYLRPLSNCKFKSGVWGHFTDKKNLYQLGCLVIIILLIAALNYILLSISRVGSRSQEVGVRKVMGARNKNVIFQFWIETQVLVTIAVLIGLLLSLLLIPLFNSLMGTQITFGDFHDWEIFIATAGLALLLGLLAGYYPALLLSRMPVVSVIKSFRTFKINPRFSTVLVILQYTACVILMISAFVINKQMRFISERNLGFDRDQIIMVKNPVWDFDFTNRVKQRLADFAKTRSYVSYFSGMNGGLDGSYNTNGFMLNGEQHWRKQLTVDFDYFEMLKLPILQGRSFSKSYPADSSRKMRATVVNETLFKLLGKTAKLGEFNEPLQETIVGVVKDYNFESLTQKIQPEDHVLPRGGYVSNFMFKIQAGHVSESIEKIGAEWKNITAGYPYEYTFMDQNIQKMYESDQRWMSVIQFACFFAVFIACLGLFGLSSINAINRFKEIGIRKILGASVADIVSTLSLKFVLWVGISIVIAIPIAWIVMNRYLEDFAYRIKIGWMLPAAVGVLAVVIAFITISIQAIRAALANPVSSLQSE